MSHSDCANWHRTGDTRCPRCGVPPHSFHQDGCYYTPPLPPYVVHYADKPARNFVEVRDALREYEDDDNAFLVRDTRRPLHPLILCLSFNENQAFCAAQQRASFRERRAQQLDEWIRSL